MFPYLWILQTASQWSHLTCFSVACIPCKLVVRTRDLIKCFAFIFTRLLHTWCYVLLVVVCVCDVGSHWWSLTRPVNLLWVTKWWYFIISCLFTHWNTSVNRNVLSLNIWFPWGTVKIMLYSTKVTRGVFVWLVLFLVSLVTYGCKHICFVLIHCSYSY